MKYSTIFKLVALTSTLALTGCYHSKSKVKFVSDQKDVWIEKTSSNGKQKGREMLYCRANEKKDGTAKPSCFQVKIDNELNEVVKSSSKKK